MKIIKIESCKDCPYIVVEPHLHARTVYSCNKEVPIRSWTNTKRRKIGFSTDIPDWCPLDDAPDKTGG